MFRYRKTEPKDHGMYACRAVEQSFDPDAPETLEDIFLWFDGEWHFQKSLDVFHGKVVGWIGPLQR